ncbi:MAG: winged helix-turn-helix transcriptional regulator [Desulfobacteraceae bacterium]|nr:MAG: winged helix-turn-helix transcriptional regulator [Desulfobacteraceae bacterium]
MIEPYSSNYLEPSKQYRKFSILSLIQKNPDITQKFLGQQASLSSSMVNNYIKELSSENLIYTSGSSNRSMTYHLTDQGKEYVATNFLAFSAEIVQFYAGVRSEIVEILLESYAEGIRTVVLYGASDTAEIVYSAIKKTELTLTGVVDNDPNKIGKLFFGTMIHPPLKINEIRPDALMITSFARQNEILEMLEGKIDDQIKIKMVSRLWV